MSYALGIDVGTTTTVAAVRRVDARGPAAPEVLPLGTASTGMPSVVHVGEDGALLFGEAAERRSTTSPDRVVRESKRRLGDPVPIVVGSGAAAAAVRPEDLAAATVVHVVALAAEREGGPAAAVTVTHPASWGAARTSLLREALTRAGLDGVQLLTEPQAAALAHAERERVLPGSTVAIYDLGGGTFDAAVLRKDDDGVVLLGRPEGLDRLGGADFDDAVLARVLGGVQADLPPLDARDPAVLTALRRLRRECVEAKEALSADTEATVPVLLPGYSGSVRLVRAELEELVADRVQETVAALARAVASAGVAADDLDAVLLVGGSSRVPLVAQAVSAGLRRPVAVDADPAATVALGAAVAASAALAVPAAPAAPVALVGAAPPDPAPRTPVAESDVPRPPEAAGAAERPTRAGDGVRSSGRRGPRAPAPAVPRARRSARGAGRARGTRRAAGAVAVGLALVTISATAAGTGAAGASTATATKAALGSVVVPVAEELGLGGSGVVVALDEARDEVAAVDEPEAMSPVARTTRARDAVVADRRTATSAPSTTGAPEPARATGGTTSTDEEGPRSGEGSGGGTGGSTGGGSGGSGGTGGSGGQTGGSSSGGGTGGTGGTGSGGSGTGTGSSGGESGGPGGPGAGTGGSSGGETGGSSGDGTGGSGGTPGGDSGTGGSGTGGGGTVDGGGSEGSGSGSEGTGSTDGPSPSTGGGGSTGGGATPDPTGSAPTASQTAIEKG